MLEEVGFENSRAKVIFPGMATIWQAEKPNRHENSEDEKHIPTSD